METVRQSWLRNRLELAARPYILTESSITLAFPPAAYDVHSTRFAPQNRNYPRRKSIKQGV
jgi:hypothetical protein